MEISPAEQRHLKRVLERSKEPTLLATYLSFVEVKDKVSPILFLAAKKIYRSQEEILAQLDKEENLWRETEIIVVSGQANINAQTKRIYICPYSGKAFGDNTHPNPQDAIYYWVTKQSSKQNSPQRSKKFFVSEDPEVISKYTGDAVPEVKRKVYSSRFTGKLFHDKQAVIDDFIANQLRPMKLAEVARQNRYDIEESFLQFIQEILIDERLQEFVSAIESVDELATYTKGWLDDSE